MQISQIYIKTLSPTFISLRALSVFIYIFYLISIIFKKVPFLFPGEFDQLAFSFDPSYLGNQLVIDKGISCLLTEDELKCLSFFMLQFRSEGQRL